MRANRVHFVSTNGPRRPTSLLPAIAVRSSVQATQAPEHWPQNLRTVWSGKLKPSPKDLVEIYLLYGKTPMGNELQKNQVYRSLTDIDSNPYKLYWLNILSRPQGNDLPEDIINTLLPKIPTKWPGFIVTNRVHEVHGEQFVNAFESADLFLSKKTKRVKPRKSTLYEIACFDLNLGSKPTSSQWLQILEQLTPDQFLRFKTVLKKYPPHQDSK